MRIEILREDENDFEYVDKEYNVKLSDAELWEYIREDLPYLDLTTHLLEVPGQKAELTLSARGKVVAACIEEAARIAELLDCRVKETGTSGKWMEEGTLLTLQGDSEKLHEAWRLCQILLEYACGMATYAREMLENVHEINPECEIFITRKSFPFAKRFCVRALLCGGVIPHRLGLSETVLVFEQHRKLYENEVAFESAFKKLKSRCIEKKLVIECDTVADAVKMLALGADVIQMDKCSPDVLRNLMLEKNRQYPHAKILAAGGIHRDNAAEFADTGIEGIVSSRPYQAGMADIKATWRRI